MPISDYAKALWKPVGWGLSRTWGLMSGEGVPKWVLPVWGAAAAAPVVAYELSKHKKKPEPIDDTDPEEVGRRMQLSAERRVKQALFGKQARLDDLKLLRETIQRAKQRSGASTGLRLREGLDQEIEEMDENVV